MKVRKIKFSANCTKIEWFEQTEKDKRTTHQDSFDDLPIDAFQNEMQKLSISLCEICDYPLKESENITITGLTLTHGKDADDVKIVITGKAKVKLSNSPRNDVSPIFSVKEIETDDGYNDLRRKLRDKIDILTIHTQDFIAGVRKEKEQKEIFPEDTHE